ncbi:MAG TPA: outer membrane protein transport protein [Azospirillum sp.]
MSRPTLSRRLAALTLAAFTPIGAAHATDIYTFEGIGAVSMGMGGTGIAHDIGGSAMIVNPATLTARPGSYLDAGIKVAAPTGLEATQTTTGEKARGKDTFPLHSYYVPQGGLVWRKDAFAVGAGVYAQGGFGTDYGHHGFLSRVPSGVNTGLRQGSEAMFLRAPLAVAWDATPDLTVAGAVDYVRAGLGVRLLQGADQLGALMAQGRLTGAGALLPTAAPIIGAGGGIQLDIFDPSIVRSGMEGGGVSGRLGATWKARPDTTIGAFYQFRTALEDLTGDGRVVVVSPTGAQLAAAAKYTMRDFQLPAEFGFGITHSPTPALTLAFDYRRALWSQVMKNFNVRVDVPGLGTVWETLPQHYNDIDIVAIGAAYRVTDALTLRAGVRWAGKAAPNQDFLAVVPVTIRNHVGVGAGYAFSEALRVDAAYSHGFQACVNNGTPPNGSAVNPARFCNGTDIVALNVTARF